jgi:predicted nucleotidyltransferase
VVLRISGLELLNIYKQQIKLLGEANGISNIRIFGSVIRGVDRPDSDIDLLKICCDVKLT